MWLLVLLLVALRLDGHRSLGHRLDLTLRLRARALLAGWASLGGVRSSLGRALLTTGRLIALSRTVPQVGASVGGLVAGLEWERGTGISEGSLDSPKRSYWRRATDWNGRYV